MEVNDKNIPDLGGYARLRQSRLSWHGLVPQSLGESHKDDLLSHPNFGPVKESIYKFESLTQTKCHIYIQGYHLVCLLKAAWNEP